MPLARIRKPFYALFTRPLLHEKVYCNQLYSYRLFGFAKSSNS